MPAGFAVCCCPLLSAVLDFVLFLVWTGVLAGRPCVVRWVKLVHQVIRKREADMFLKAIASLFESALTVLTTSPSALGAAFDPNIVIAGALHDP